MAVDTLHLSEIGVRGDRELMVVKDNRKMNLKDLPALAKITVERTESGQLMLRAEGFEAVTHHKILEGDTGSIRFLLDTVHVVDQGEEIADWISRVVCESVKLVTTEKPFSRNLPAPALEKIHGNSQHNFVDVAPVMIVNGATLDDLNSRISQPVPVQRFRPNIVVGGLEAYAEDDISRMQGTEFEFTHISPCERCVIINTDHETGERTQKDPLKMLNQYRRIPDGYDSGVLFGSYYSVKGSGTLRVGDSFEVSNAQ